MTWTSVYEARFGGGVADERFRSTKEDRAELGPIWYCRLGRSARASREGGGVDL